VKNCFYCFSAAECGGRDTGTNDAASAAGLRSDTLLHSGVIMVEVSANNSHAAASDCSEVCDFISDDSAASETNEGPLSVDLGTYSRDIVTNIPRTSDDSDPSNPRTYFDLGLRFFFAYMHEDAYKMFLAVLTLAPNCALAHGLVALCHSPNYNFKGMREKKKTGKERMLLPLILHPPFIRRGVLREH